MHTEDGVFGVRIDAILYGLRPAVLIGGFRRHLSWRGADDVSPSLAKGLRAYWRDGFFASLSDNLAGHFFELFIIALGGGNREVGAMASIGNMMGFLSLAPGVAAVRLFKSRKPVVLIFGAGIGRFMYLGLALVPFLCPDPTIAVAGVVALNSIRVFMGNFSNPAWTGMTADLVPERIRGSYFASRNAAISVIGSVSAFSAGWIVSYGNRAALFPLFGFSLLFVLTFIFGMCSTWAFSQVPDLGPRIGKAHRSLSALIRGFLAYPAFLSFLLFSFLWNFALQVAGPFFNVYLVRQLGADPSMIGITATIGSIIQAVAMPFWGRMIDRRGNARVLALSGFLIPLLPLSWLLTTRVWEPLIINGVGGFLWAGFGLANFNLLLKMIPESDRQEGAALYQGLILLSMVVAPLVGMELVEFGGYKLAFAASGICRYIAIVVLYLLVLRKLRK